MQTDQNKTDILVVGAGMAGLTAASELHKAGYDILVIDKSRGVGGRCATRRIGQATFDHGAQFITARTSRFINAIDRWHGLGVAEAWFKSAAGHRRWRGNPSMTAIAKHLARDIEVRRTQRITALHREPKGWRAVRQDGATIMANAVVLTPPVPQSLDILAAGAVTLAPETRAQLENITYEACFAVMAVLDKPAKIPLPGGLAVNKGPIAWIADNQIKGISAVPAVTIHTTAAFSAAHWDDDRQKTARTLVDAAVPYLGSNVIDFQIHGWRYSKPTRTVPHACLVLRASPPLLLAGDAFGGPRVEGAVLSGWATAERLTTMDFETV